MTRLLEKLDVRILLADSKLIESLREIIHEYMTVILLSVNSSLFAFSCST